MTRRFSEKDFAEDNLTVLDVRARDETGRVTNIEMQLLLPAHFKARILTYWADMFRQQLRQGDSYAKLRPAVSIYLTNQGLFPDALASPDYPSSSCVPERMAGVSIG